jgi:hypothetical protein
MWPWGAALWQAAARVPLASRPGLFIRWALGYQPQDRVPGGPHSLDTFSPAHW